jgi:Fe-S-cluster containining protein
MRQLNRRPRRELLMNQPLMDLRSHFSYLCNQCGRCCHGQVITLSPYDVIRVARAAGISTGEAIARYTIRRGSILKFVPNGRCSALDLDVTACTLHSGRPLACRLYPLGLECDRQGTERYISLEPAAGSRGIYGDHGTVEDLLATQGAEPYLRINRRYAALLSIFQDRITELCDFDVIEPREFWRAAVREALAETNFDFNPIIAALFDLDGLGCRGNSEIELIDQHIKEIERRIRIETDPALVASAAVMLSVSLGYSPREVALTDRSDS